MDKADIIFIISIVTGAAQFYVNANLNRRVARLEGRESKWGMW
jgi:hypothetical protein